VPVVNTGSKKRRSESAGDKNMCRKKISLVILIIFVSFFSGCGRGRGTQNESDVLATVNGEPLYVSDFNRSIALNIKRDPMFKITPQTLDNQIDMLIDKKLLIQEARDKNLDRTKRFENTIKTFWEQTLIRDLISRQEKEIENTLSVNAKEITEYYKNITTRKKFQIIKTKDRLKVVNILKKDPGEVEWEQTIGPVSYDDASDLIKKAFIFPKGMMRVLQEGDTYYLFHVSSVEKVPAPPLDEIKNDVKERVIALKKQRLFKEWLALVREKAEIRINKNKIKGLGYDHE